MQKPFSPNPRSESSLGTLESVPKKEEWAIINKYKALEFERMKHQEHMLDRQKKEQFRHALDNQMNSRSNAEQKEREENRNYYQKLAEAAEQQRQKQQLQKRNRFLNRKNVDQQNVNKFENRSRVKDSDSGYHLEIGVKSEKDHIEKSQLFRKEMMDTLDIQLRQKSQEQKYNQLQNLQLEEMHKKKQDSLFQQQSRKNYGQNQKVYEYYQQLDKQKQMRQQDLEHKFVDEARRKHLMAQMEKEKQQQMKKLHNKEVVLDTLGQQVKDIRRKRVEDSITNPEDLSFKFISGIFQPKYPGYDKNKYKHELKQQAEENKIRKQRQNMMNDQQYKLNMNQLSKAVMGDFAQKNYLDRSLGAIGEKYQIDKVDKDLKDDDVEVIKGRIKNIKHKGNMSTIL